MQRTKKLLSLLLAVVVLLAMMAVPVAYAEQFSDVPQSYRYYDAVESLAARGIINGMGDGTYAPDAEVKRSEFAKIVCIGVLSSGELEQADNTGFTDVSAEHWASGYIKVAAAAGIINGMGDGTFAPDDPVKYEQAVKMLVCALGYGSQAESRGGYPDGYMNMGGSLAILKSVNDGVIGQAANRGLIAKLVDNSLNVEVLDPVTGKTTGTLKEKDDKQSIKGQVVSVYGSTIYAGEESPCGRQQIEIEKGSKRELYSIEKLNINANDYLGRAVTVYYDEEAGADYYEITSISLQKGKNKVTKIDMNLIDDYSNTKIEYQPSEDEDFEDASIDSAAKIIFNGKAVTTSLSTLINSSADDSGEITLLDAEGSGSASVVFVKTYKTYVVSRTDKTNYKVYDKITSDVVELNVKDRSKMITFSKGTSSASFETIVANDVISVSTSSDGKMIDVIISSSKSVPGTISEISSDNMTLKISGKEYRVAKNCQTLAKEKFGYDVKATFYLDAFGKIAFADNFGVGAGSTYKYAYLLGVGKKGGTSDDVSVRLYNITGSTSMTSDTIPLKSTVKINTTSYKNDPDGVMGALKDSAALVNVGSAAANAEDYTQVIKYTMDGSEINKIITYTGESDVGNGDVLNIDNLSAAEIEATATNKLGKYSISGAKVVVIPKDDRIQGKYTGKSTSSFKIGTAYAVQLVDVSSTNVAKAVILYPADEHEETDMEQVTASMITSVSRSIKAPEGFDTENVTVLEVLDLKGNKKEYYSDGTQKYSVMKDSGAAVPSGSGNFKDLQPGDVVKVSVDDNNRIEEIMLIAKADDVVSGKQSPFTFAEGNNGTAANAQHRYLLGSARVIDKTDGYSMVVTPFYADDSDYDSDASQSKDETFTGISDNVLVYIVDTTQSREEKRADTAHFEDILPATRENGIKQEREASKILIYTSYEKIQMIVIFK